MTIPCEALKTCSKCGETKPVTDFYLHGSKKYYVSECKVCNIARRHNYYFSHRLPDIKAKEKVAAKAMSEDHDRRSPNCKITKLDEVMIPIDNDSSKLGGVVRPKKNI